MGFEENRKNESRGEGFQLKRFLKGKSVIFCTTVLILAMAVMFFQNAEMIEQMKKVMGQTDTEIHELYDDSAVVKAYKSGAANDAENLNAEDSFVLEKAKEVLDQVITDDMTDYEKEKAIYDWQVAWVNYQNQNLSPMASGGVDQSHLPYGVLKNHEAICVGNATTFKLFMDMLDIPCQIIHSTEAGEHAWNLVQLEGDWYHVDITFDGSSDGRSSYTYFNVPDSVKDDGAWPWDHSKFPAANGTKYCYILNHAAVLDDLYQIPQMLAAAMEDGRGTASFILKDEEGFTRDVAEYIGENMMPANCSLYYQDAYAMEGKTVYCYSIEQIGEGTGGDDSQIYQKLDEKISQASAGYMDYI